MRLDYTCIHQPLIVTSVMFRIKHHFFSVTVTIGILPVRLSSIIKTNSAQNRSDVSPNFEDIFFSYCISTQSLDPHTVVILQFNQCKFLPVLVILSLTVLGFSSFLPLRFTIFYRVLSFASITTSLTEPINASFHRHRRGNAQILYRIKRRSPNDMSTRLAHLT